MWYDIYDHNDPGKTHQNWSLLSETEYTSASWFPLGECVPALALTKPGSVLKEEVADGMQSFSLEQMKLDAQKLQSSMNISGLSTTVEQAALSRKQSPIAPVPQLPPSSNTSENTSTGILPPPIPTTSTVGIPVKTDLTQSSAEAQIMTVLKLFAEYKAGEDVSVGIYSIHLELIYLMYFIDYNYSNT